MLLVRNAAQVVCVASNGERALYGEEMSTPVVLSNSSLVIGADGCILAIGSTAEIEERFQTTDFKEVIDATGKAIVPGLCDAHTHAVWSGDRVHEFSMKLAGATYMEVHKMGGGINFTVDAVRESSLAELVEQLHERLWRMASHGTTLVEVKSGYGLNLENEVKMLKAIHSAQKTHPLDLVGNFCGAHSVPKGTTAEDATVDIVDNQLPEIARLIERDEISPELVDVFCEKGVFDKEQTRRILRAGVQIGLKSNFHGDELNPLGSAELSADSECQVIGISHLECVSPAGIESMVKAKSVAVLLPTTAYVLRIEVPPARKLISSGVAVALGSDFNPNAHCLSMPFVMNLACVTMHMTMPEAIVAATLNAAASMGRSSTHGSLEVGKVGDFVLIDAPCWEHLIYQLVDPPIEAVYKSGVRVWPKRS